MSQFQIPLPIIFDITTRLGDLVPNFGSLEFIFQNGRVIDVVCTVRQRVQQK